MHSLHAFVLTESRWLKVIRRSPRARCLPMPSLCRHAVRNIRKRTQRFQSTLQSFRRSAQRGGRYLNLLLPEGITSWFVCLRGKGPAALCSVLFLARRLGHWLGAPDSCNDHAAFKTVFLPVQTFPCGLVHFPVPKQCLLAAASLMVSVLQEDSGCACLLPVNSHWLSTPAESAVPSTGPSSPGWSSSKTKQILKLP